MHAHARKGSAENDRKWQSATQSKLAILRVFPILRLSTSTRKIMQVCQAGSSPEQPLWCLWAVTLSDCHGKIGAAQTADRHFLRAQGTWSAWSAWSTWRWILWDRRGPLRISLARHSVLTHHDSQSLAITGHYFYIYIYTYVVQYYKTDRQRRRDCSGQLPDVPIRIY